MKTTTASKAPDSLIIAAEEGYKGLPGVHAVSVKEWVDVLTVQAQLKKPEVKAKYKTIIIDTLDSLTFIALQEIFLRTGVSDLKDIPYGGGYVMLENMFRKLFKTITDNYGLIITAHPNQKQEDIADSDKKNTYWDLAVNKKVKGIAVGLMDMLIYVEADRRPNKPNIAHFKASENWEAKCRFADIVPSVEFNYENIQKAVLDATGAKSTQRVDNSKPAVLLDEAAWNALREEVSDLATAKVATSGAEKVVQKIAEILNKRIADTTVADAERMGILKQELQILQ